MPGKITAWCEAASVNGYVTALFRMPKLHFVCGNCFAPFSTREYITVSNMDDRIAGFCPYCQHWNVTNLVKT